MSARLNQLKRKITKELRIGGAGSRTFLQVQTKNQILANIQATLDDGFADIKTSLERNLFEVAALETELAATVVNEKAGVELVTTSFTAEQLEAAVKFAPLQGTTVAGALSTQARNVQERFQRDIVQGVLAGETNEQIRKNLGNMFNQTNQQMRALVRTSVQEVANNARIATWEANSNVVKAVQQISTLDDRTTQICIAYSNKIWTLPEYIPVGHDLSWNGGPPRHWQCRSTTTPIVRSFKELGLDVDEPDEGRRAAKIEDPNDPSSLIGADVPAGQDFDEFLNNRGKSFQNELLGPRRAELFRAGRISTTDLVDFQGNPLTLDELKALDKPTPFDSTAALRSL